jgi:peptide/nickel transport system permease protein
MAARGGSLGRYIVTRLLLVIPNILVLLTMVFLLMRVAPGDPVSAALGGRLAPEEIAKRRAAAGFDRPLLTQYWDYVSGVLHLDFGSTLTDNRKVTDILVVNGGATLTLTVSALIVALAIGIPGGLIAGRYRDSVSDVGIRLFGILTYAAPVFFTGLLFQMLFTSKLGWLPSGTQASAVTQATVETKTHIFLLDTVIAGDADAFLDGLEHLAMPAITLGLLMAGVFIRLVRVNVAQSMRDDYIEAARARGVPERTVVIRHAFRNAMVPFVTILGLQVALLFGGAILTEQTCSWPGIGTQLLRYLNNRDYSAVQGIITVFALVVVLISLAIDIINALIDPRVRY